MNIFQKLGVKIADFGKWFAGTVKTIVGLAIRVESILKSEKPLEQPFIAGEAGIEQGGQDFPHPVGTEIETEQAIAILEGKPATTPAVS